MSTKTSTINLCNLKKETEIVNDFRYEVSNVEEKVDKDINMIKIVDKYKNRLIKIPNSGELVGLYVKKDPKHIRHLVLRIDFNKTILENFRYLLKRKSVKQNFFKKTIKKSVRVDNDIYSALMKTTKADIVKFDEKHVSTFVRKTILDQFKTKNIDLIATRNFTHKITIHFIKEEYDYIHQIIKDFKAKGIKYITFSLLARSILYKTLNLVENELSQVTNKKVA